MLPDNHNGERRMPSLRAEFSNTGGAVTLVSAVPGRIIRVVRLLLHSAQSGAIRLVADPAGAAQDLTPRLHLAAQGRIALLLAPPYAIDTPRSMSLGLNGTFAFTSNYGVMLWYELVD